MGRFYGLCATGIWYPLMIWSTSMGTNDPVSSSTLIVSSLFSPQSRIMLIIGIVPIFGLGIPSPD